MGVAMNSNNYNWNSSEMPWVAVSKGQQGKLIDEAESRTYKKGDVIWSNIDDPTGIGVVYMVATGTVRLELVHGHIPPDSLKKVRCGEGSWIGDILHLSGHWQAFAASHEVQIFCWPASGWCAVETPELRNFWQQERWRYQPIDPHKSYPVNGYPYCSDPNSAVACLVMATQLAEAPITPEQIHNYLRSQEPEDVVYAAERTGYDVQSLVIADWSELQEISFPALAQLGIRQEPHWVLIYAVERDRIILADPLNPGDTCESWPQVEIEASWNGDLWTIQPQLKAKTFGLSWFVPAIWRYRRLLGEVLVASLVIELLGLATPMLTQVVIDKAIPQHSLNSLQVMVFAIFCVGLFEAALGILRMFLFSHTTRRLDLSLSSQLFRHLLELPLQYFESRRVGDTVANVQELENIRQFLTGTTLTVVLDALFTGVYIAVMAAYSLKLTLASLAVVPLCILLIIGVTPILRQRIDEAFNCRADSQSFLLEVVSGIHAVKAHVAQRQTRERWEGLFARYGNANFKAETLANFDGHIAELLTHISEVLILFVGAQLVINGQFTIGSLVAFQMLSGQAIGPILRFAQLWEEVQRVLLSVSRLGQILNAIPEERAEAGLVVPPLTGQTRFDGVSFQYADCTEPVLQKVSFDIEAGMTVGIVGRSGSGKSTLIKTFLRLYNPTSGRILLDGIDTKGVDLRSLRQQFGVVLQDDFLFGGTILENIRFGTPHLLMEEVITSAKNAVAHDFIMNLPNNYLTHIGERGIGLSGGQRQRIALARFFKSDAPILILDEATSALDAETERQVLRNLHQFAQGRTVFISTHRLANLKSVDTILVLEQGRLEEQGSHLELLQANGIYAALYRQQHPNGD